MTGLSLKKAAVVDQDTRDKTKGAFDILKEVQNKVRAMGIQEVPQPSEVPQSLGDTDVGAIPNREIESLYGRYLAYASYLLPRLAELEAAYKISTANLKRIAADIKLQLADGVPKAELSAHVASHPVFLEHELEHLKLFATKEILGSYYKAYSKQAQALSRIIELRKLEQEQELRGHKIGTTKRPNRLPQGGFSR